MIEAVIFDVDGTLVDSVDFHAESWERAFARHGHDIAFEALRAQIGKGGDQLMPEFLTDAELKSVGPKVEGERGAIFAADYLDRVKGFPGCGDLFRALRRRGLRIALASSSKSAELRVYKAAAGVDGLTDVETSSDDAETVEASPGHLPGRPRRPEAVARPRPRRGRHALRRRGGASGRDGVGGGALRRLCRGRHPRRPGRPGSTAIPPTCWPTSTTGSPDPSRHRR